MLYCCSIIVVAVFRAQVVAQTEPREAAQKVVPLMKELAFKPVSEEVASQIENLIPQKYEPKRKKKPFFNTVQYYRDSLRRSLIFTGLASIGLTGIISAIIDSVQAFRKNRSNSRVTELSHWNLEEVQDLSIGEQIQGKIHNSTTTLIIFLTLSLVAIITVYYKFLIQRVAKESNNNATISDKKSQKSKLKKAKKRI